MRFEAIAMTAGGREVVMHDCKQARAMKNFVDSMRSLSSSFFEDATQGEVWFVRVVPELEGDPATDMPISEWYRDDIVEAMQRLSRLLAQKRIRRKQARARRVAQTQD